MNPNRNPFHGEFSSSDAHALSESAARFAIYNRFGVAQSAMLATDQWVITDIEVSAAGAILLVTVFDGPDNSVDAGEIISQGQWPQQGGEARPFQTPHYCKPGTWPKVITDQAGQVYVHIKGHLESTTA